MSLYHTRTDKQLLSLLQNGDKEAFTTLFEAYRDKLYSFILHLSGSSEIAGDVLQDVFLKIWHDRYSLGDITNFNAYLFRMAQNRAVNLLLRRSKELLILKEIGYKQTKSIDIEEVFAEHEVQELLRKAMEQLPQQQRRVFELSRQEGLKYKEIAVCLGISTSTVRNHMVHALKTIREFVRSAYPEGIMYGMILLLILSR